MRRAFDLAIERQNSGDLDGAIRAWRAILLHSPDSVAALNNLGIALRRAGRIAESEAVLRTGIERHPMTAELHLSLGQTRQEWGRDDEAEQEFIRASVLDPKIAGPQQALGTLYLAQGRVEDGIRALRAAVRADEGHAPSLVALAKALFLTGKVDQAAGMLNKALGLDPALPEAHLALAELLLLAGDYPSGFKELQWRHGPPPDQEAARPATGDGVPAAIDCDGGFSETILLIRLVRAMAGARPIVRCPPPLADILRACGWLDTVIAATDGEEDTAADRAVPLSRLPLLVGIEQDAVPAPPPYLRADPSALAHWRARLPQDGICIGIHWAGGHSDIPLQAFKPLADLPGVHLVSLQKGAGRGEISGCGFPVLDFGVDLDETTGAFVDSAALISVLPLVIGNESAVTHLAGALDKTVWVALPPAPHWCFGVDGNTTPWYPSARLFRRDSQHSWKHVMSQIAHAVSELREVAQGYRA